MRGGGATPIFSLRIKHVRAAGGWAHSPERCGVHASVRMCLPTTGNAARRRDTSNLPPGSGSGGVLMRQLAGFAPSNALLYGPRQFVGRLFGLSIKNLEEPNEGVSTHRGGTWRACA